MFWPDGMTDPGDRDRETPSRLRQAGAAVGIILLIAAAPGSALAAVGLAAANDGIPPDDYDAANRSSFFMSSIGLTVLVGLAEAAVFTRQHHRTRSATLAVAAALIPGLVAITTVPVLSAR